MEGGMKKLMALAFCVLSAILVVAKDSAQPFPRDEAGKVAFQGVVQVEGVPAADLYARAKYWAARNFVSAKDVLQLDDPANGRLMYKGFHTEPFGLTETIDLWFTFTVEVKDGKYRWTIDQIGEGFHGPEHPIEKMLNKDGVGVVGRKAVFERDRQFFIGVGASLEKAMKTAPGAKDF
jgi:hypothetical protein